MVQEDLEETMLVLRKESSRNILGLFPQVSESWGQSQKVCVWVGEVVI